MGKMTNTKNSFHALDLPTDLLSSVRAVLEGKKVKDDKEEKAEKEPSDKPMAAGDEGKTQEFDGKDPEDNKENVLNKKSDHDEEDEETVTNPKKEKITINPKLEETVDTSIETQRQARTKLSAHATLEDSIKRVMSK